jgi:CheY-like chemotaxis protein
MVVEDEPGIYEVLLAMFEMWGVNGVAFVDGEEAVAWIEDVDKGRAKGEKPELALIDIRLPGAVQGEMVGERVRKSPYLKDMAMILITAFQLTPAEERALVAQAGADRLVYKPLPRFNDLKALCESVIVERRAHLAAAPAVVSAAKPLAAGVKPAELPLVNKPADSAPPAKAKEAPLTTAGAPETPSNAKSPSPNSSDK